MLPGRPSLLVLVAISTLQPIALNILAPATPALARGLEASYATVQLTLTLYLVAVALTQLVVGPLSDRFGRRPCVLAGIALYLAGSVLGALASTTDILLLARGLEGAGAGTAFSLARAIIRDTSGRDDSARQIATVTMVMVVAPMIAPYIGGQIETRFGWRMIFWFMAGVGAIVLAMSLLRLPETAPDLGKRTPISGIFKAFPLLIRDRSFTANVTALTMTSGAFFAFVAAGPFIVVEVMGHGSDVYGSYFVLTAFGYMTGNFAMSRLVGRFGSVRLVLTGLLISSLGLSVALAFALSPGWTPVTLFGPLMLNALGNGLTIPGATAVGLSARPDLAGSAAGLMGAIQLGAGAVATIAVSALVVVWPQALVAMMWGMTLIGLICLWPRPSAR